eukprot:TRINITY_DN1854_c0_g4_i1.p1 TRINITY_DN1854_c0_g4~~TRINITY_DN1854_c0_g4_i1.p1  ORF type:complete len:385 (-),score=48.41 TRINITY_DN1854_c0_g4_i1:383-1537(-)
MDGEGAKLAREAATDLMPLVATETSASPTALDTLPDEILIDIFALLAVRDLGALSSVCRRLSRLADEDSLWQRLCVAAIHQPTKVKPQWSWKQHLRQWSSGPEICCMDLIRGEVAVKNVLTFDDYPDLVAVGLNGFAAVFSVDEYCVARFYDQAGTVLAQVDLAKRLPPALRSDGGIRFEAGCFDCSGRLLLADGSGRCVVRVSAAGELHSVCSLDRDSTSPIQLLACAPDGTLVAVSGWDIEFFEPSGRLLRQFRFEKLLFACVEPAAGPRMYLLCAGPVEDPTVMMVGSLSPTAMEEHSMVLPNWSEIYGIAADAAGRVACMVRVTSNGTDRCTVLVYGSLRELAHEIEVPPADQYYSIFDRLGRLQLLGVARLTVHVVTII